MTVSTCFRAIQEVSEMFHKRFLADLWEGLHETLVNRHETHGALLLKSCKTPLKPP